ncbi:hypothetical protein BGW41_006587, partial [Actinomortierella wolfii]
FSAVLAVLAAAVAVQAAPTPVHVPALNGIQLAELGITTPVEITVKIDPTSRPIVSVDSNPEIPLLKPLVNNVESLVESVLATLPLLPLKLK